MSRSAVVLILVLGLVVASCGGSGESGGGQFNTARSIVDALEAERY